MEPHDPDMDQDGCRWVEGRRKESEGRKGVEGETEVMAISFDTFFAVRLLSLSHFLLVPQMALGTRYS